MWYLIGVLALVAIAAFVFWRLKRSLSDQEEEHQMLSFVALLKKPQRLEPIYIATAAKKAWNATLSYAEDDDEGPDGFVVGQEGLPTLMVRFRDRMVMINNFPSPYMEDPETAAEDIPDMRLRSLVSQHTAWISCDALGVESFHDLDEVREWYKVLGRMLAELVDDNCLAILLPQTQQVFPNMDETLELLKAEDPLEALGFEAPAAVLQISDDDPRMIKAVEEARRTWPNFVAAFEQKAGEEFGVKAPISRDGNTEFIWISVTAIENDVIYGELANDPVALGNLKLGSRVKTTVSDLNDWVYLSKDGPQGMFTSKVIIEANQ